MCIRDRVLRFWNSDPLDDVAEAAQWAAAQGVLQASRGFAQRHVSETAGGRSVGCLGLQPLEDEVEILYALVPGAWGCGYATEASVRVSRKLGMRSLGLAEDWGSAWAKYELTAGEWRAATG